LNIKYLGRDIIQENILYPTDLDYNEVKTKNSIFFHINEIKKEGLRPIISHEHLSGYPQSGGYYNSIIARRLKNIFEDAKVIIIIRNQLDMIYSSYVHYIRTGGSCKINNFLNPPQDGAIPRFKYEYLEYHKVIELYFDLFGRENVLVLPYELFVVDPKKYVKEITSFIGVENPTNLPYKVIENKSIKGVGISAKRFANYFVSYNNSINPHVPIYVSRKTSELIKGACNKLSHYTPGLLNKYVHDTLYEKIRNNIMNKYTQSNKITNQMIEVDLKAFNYDL
jgi:hypothetical protein